MSNMTEIAQSTLVPEESDNDNTLNIKSPLGRIVSSFMYRMGFYGYEFDDFLRIMINCIYMNAKLISFHEVDNLREKLSSKKSAMKLIIKQYR